MGSARTGALQEEDANEARVLVVDDEPPLRLLCQVNLEAAGFDVREAADGEEALRLIGEEVPDLVLLDVMMPRRDGWSVAAELGRDSRTRELPVVFLTARADRQDRVRAYELGAVGYIVKPFDPLTLADKVGEVIERIARGEREQVRRAVYEGG
jgi:DNA-binding response OmpR family regulator